MPELYLVRKENSYNHTNADQLGWVDGSHMWIVPHLGDTDAVMASAPGWKNVFAGVLHPGSGASARGIWVVARNGAGEYRVRKIALSLTNEITPFNVNNLGRIRYNSTLQNLEVAVYNDDGSRVFWAQPSGPSAPVQLR